MSLESTFLQYLLVIASLLTGAGLVAALPPRRHQRGLLSDSLKADLMVARVECLLAEARAEMANEFSEEQVNLLMRPEYFPSPQTSIAACIGADIAIPHLDAPPPLDGLLHALRSKSALHRLAFAEVLETAWYSWLPGGRSLPEVFEVYGMPLKRSAT